MDAPYYEARKLIDPNVGLIFIASWNEWYEGTTIEPSKEYGSNYLEVTKEVLSGYEPTFELPKNHINFVFNKVVKTMDIEPNSSDERDLAVAFDYIEFLDKNEKVIKKIDIGTDEARSYMGVGWSGNERNWDHLAENFVWAGGSLKKSTIYIDLPKEALYLEIRANPIMDDISMAVLIDGSPIYEIDLKLGWNEYMILSEPKYEIALESSRNHLNEINHRNY